MRAFAVAWPDPQIVQRVVARLPWGQNLTLLERLEPTRRGTWSFELDLEEFAKTGGMMGAAEPASSGAGVNGTNGHVKK